MQRFSSESKAGGPVLPEKREHRAAYILILAALCLFWIWSGSVTRTAAVGTVLQTQAYCLGSSPCVTTFHNDNNRDGVNPNEAALTVPTVTSGIKVKFTQTVDGLIYAQPLFISSLIVNGVSHNVVFVATENNTVYAIDGDAGGTLWSTSLNGNGETAVPYTDLPFNCQNLIPEVGITGTPVIDVSVTPPVLYVVSKNKESNGTWVQKVHALEVDNGAELLGSPFDVASNVSGFNALIENQRPGLALSYDSSGNANVYVGWGSHCDGGAYSGVLAGFNYNYTLQAFSVVGTSYTEGTITGRKGGIWMSGSAPAVDNAGNLYLSTSDGKWSGTAKPPLLGESVLKVQQGTGSLTLADFYTPNDWLYLNQGTVGTGILLSCGTGCTISNLPNDSDLGAGGVVLLQPSGINLVTPELMVAGKEGEAYVIYYQASSNNTMGGLDGCGYNCTTGSDPTATPCTTAGAPAAGAIAYCFDAIPLSSGAQPGDRGAPAFWPGNATTPENYLYTVGSRDQLRAFQMQSNGTFGPAITQASGAATFYYPGASPSISWNSATSDAADAIVWVLSTSGAAGTVSSTARPAVLYAYAAVPSNGSLVKLWDSYTSRQAGPGAVKFVVPTVVNGKVYVAGGIPGYTPNSSNCPINSTACGQLTVYGP